MLIVLFTLASCQPEMGARSGAVGTGALSGNGGLEGVWYTDQDSERVQVSYTATSLRYVRSGVTTQRSIQFVSGSSYYDRTLAEYVDFTVSGSSARVCYEIGCHDLRKTP